MFLIQIKESEIKYLLGLKMDNNFDSDIFQTCRTCMKEIIDKSFFYLDCTPSANTKLTIRQTLYNCIPELDLSIVSNPVMCSKCVDILLSVFEFKKNCLQSEIQINKYIQQQHAGDLNLVEVLQFHQPDIKNLDIEVKIEDFEITEDFKNEDSAVNEVSEFSESTEPKYLLELQKVETQDVIFNTFDDFNINCNLSAAEENSDVHNSRKVFEHQNNYNKNLNKTNVYYQCYRCGHKAESKLKLILHLKHHTRKNFYDEIISKKFSKYRKRLICCYRCSLCSYLTKYKCLFDFHIRIHLLKKKYKHIFKLTNVHTKAFRITIKINKSNIGNKRKLVKNCKSYNKLSFKNQNKSKKSKQHLSHRNHLKPNMRAHIIEKLSCSFCEYQCKSKVNLKRHIMRVHTKEKPFLCSVCGYQCSRKSFLKRHILIHTDEKPFSCFACKYQSRWKRDLKEHVLIHTGEKPFSCFVCNYQCRRKADLKKHMPIHTAEKPFRCSVCEYQFSNRSRLKRHMLIHTGDKPFSCSVCEYRCNKKYNLKQHILIHTGEKLFSCSLCKYQCNHKSDLKKHVLIHTREKPFSCSVCKYQCSHRSLLKQHILIHAEEKPFLCSVCEYQCRRTGHLKQHMLIHTGEKPFSCSVCKCQFSQKIHLKKHIRNHTLDQPFSCSVCEYQCNFKGSLAKHMRTHI